jgi:hypothetical protein
MAPSVMLISFHPQMAFLPNLGINRRCCLCGVARYASAQQLDFLDLGQKSAFVNWKHDSVLMLILLIYELETDCFENEFVDGH